ncbi:MAG: hypothetical protein Q9220_007065 [cf. Caloplaca sp. 1 TL-2023]
MASHRPFRTRPNLHLTLTPRTGSPYNASASSSISRQYSSPYVTPSGTPMNNATYSPFHSAISKPKTPLPYGASTQFTPRQKHKYRRYCRTAWLKIQRVLSTRTAWFMVIVTLVLVWWFNGGVEQFDLVKLRAAGLGYDLFQDGVTQNMQFFPPSNPKIHNATSLYLSLRNSPVQELGAAAMPSADPTATVSNSGHLSFRPNSANNKPAPPVSLLARVDQEEYVLLVNASGLVAVCSGTLQRDATHNIRIVAPMNEDHGKGVIQLEGIWLTKGGQFVGIEGLSLDNGHEFEDALTAHSDVVGEKHRSGLKELLQGSGQAPQADHQLVLKQQEGVQDFQSRRKLLEVITDTPGSFGSKNHGKRTGGADGLLAGVMGWEYLLGEMFSVDHMAIGVDGMCLIQDCVGGVGQPSGLGDIFFRSGPPGSMYLEHPWLFDINVPDVMILNLGNSDQASFDLYASDYNQSAWDLAERFEATYLSLIKAIRTLAYPKHPATIISERSGYKTYIPNSVPASIPIFVMRPLRGELEHSTQNIVTRLRAAGDKYVYWLDTSGWLDPNMSQDSEQMHNDDFYLDKRVQPPKYRLSERGNQRTAIFLHGHVCRYLARMGEKCPFLPSEVYEGKVFDPAERDFERYLDGEKERKLRNLFWGEPAIEGNGDVDTRTKQEAEAIGDEKGGQEM